MLCRQCFRLARVLHHPAQGKEGMDHAGKADIVARNTSLCWQAEGGLCSVRLCLLSRHDPSLLYPGRGGAGHAQGGSTGGRASAQAGKMTEKLFLTLVLLAALAMPAEARELISVVSESDEIARMRPEFKIPDEPNQLFYVQRSPNSNTVVYAARLDGRGNLDAS